MRKSGPPFWAATVYDYIKTHVGSPKQKGEIGLEIEVEGINLPRQDALAGSDWLYHEDGSLRGAENGEYVINGTIKREQVTKSVAGLADICNKNKAKLAFSNRCSVHVHVNVQEMTWKDVFTYLTLYYMFEEILTDFCGEDRIGNLFCLRAIDADHIIQMLRKSIRDNSMGSLSDRNLRYAGANFVSLFRFGSVEFRSMQGTMDPKVIQQWVDLLVALKDAVKQFPRGPHEVIEAFSELGVTRFVETIFPKQYELITGLGNVTPRLHVGMRLVLDLAYASDWVYVKPEKKKKTAGEASVEELVAFVPEDEPPAVWGHVPRGRGPVFVVNAFGDDME